MCELFGALIGIAVIVTLIAVIGHGLWLTGGAVWQALFGQPDAAKTKPLGHCPHCGARLEVVLGRCRTCGQLTSDPPRFTLEGDLAAVERQLQRLGRSGAIDADRQSELLRIVREQRNQLNMGMPVGPVPQAAVRPAPTAEPPAPAKERVAQETAPPHLEPARRKEVSRPASVGPVAPPVPKSPDVAAVTPAAPAPVPISREPAPGKKRAFADLLQAFMEEKNIRWGELISGMLIVISSIGLVISLWATLKETIPYFPALLFLLVTAAIHGAGLYTLRRWKLESTSRGLLLISTLLIPLNFLAAIAVSADRPVTDPLYATAVTVGLLAFGAISLSAGRILTPRCWWLLLIAVMGPSIDQLLIDRMAGPGLSTIYLTLLFAPTVLAFLVANGGQLAMCLRGPDLTEERAGQLFTLLGISAFALAMPVGLLIWKTDSIRTTLAALSPLLSLAAVTVVGLGVSVGRRATDASLATVRTVGTWLALVGEVLMVAAVVLAWPRPELLVAVGLVDFVALTILAVAAELPVLHTSALAALTLSYVVGFHLFQGHVSIGSGTTNRELTRILLWGSSGAAICVLSIITAIVAVLLKRCNRVGEATSYLWNTAGLASVAVIVAVYSGFWSGIDRSLATPVLALYAAVTLAAGPWLRRASVTWFGSGLLLLTLAHGLHWNPQIVEFLSGHGLLPRHPFVVIALLHATLSGAIALLTGRILPTRKRVRELGETYCTPLCFSALISSGLMLPVILRVEAARFGPHCGYAFWAAGAWLVIAFALDSRLLFAASQTLATIAVCFGVTAFCRVQNWWSGCYLDPHHLQFQLGALAVWSMTWTAVRTLGGRFPLLGRLMHSQWPAIDRIVLGGVVAGVVGLALAGCLPGISAELATASSGRALDAGVLDLTLLLVFAWAVGSLLAASPTLSHKHAAGHAVLGLAAAWTIAVLLTNTGVAQVWTSAGVSHASAYDSGTWIVLGLTFLALLVSLWETFSPIAVLGLIVAAVAVPLVWAGPFETKLATASALRWGLAIYAVIAIGLMCCRDFFSAALRRLRRPRPRDDSPDWLQAVRALVLAVTILPILAMTLRFTAATLTGNVLAAPLVGTLFHEMGAAWSYAGPLCLLAVGLNLFAIHDRQPLFTLAGSMLVQLAVSLAYILSHWTTAPQRGFTTVVELLQWNGLALGGYSLLWLSGRQWIEPPTETGELTDWKKLSPLGTQITLTQAVVLSLPVWAAVAIFFSPGHLPVWMTSLGTAESQWALLLAAAVSVWFYRRQLPEAAVHVAVPVGMGLAALVAAATVAANNATNWISYHMLTAGWIAMGGLATALACLSTFLRRSHVALAESDVEASGEDVELPPSVEQWESVTGAAVYWATVLGGLVVLLAFRGEWSDPARPFWSVVATALVAVFTAALAIRGRTQKFAYAATALAAVATTFAYMSPWLGIGVQAATQSWVVLVEANVIAVALAGVFWLAVELSWQFRRNVVFDQSFASPPAHHAAAIVGLVLAGVLAVGCLWLRTLTHGTPQAGFVDVSTPGGWLMLSCLGVLLAGSLWDRTARHAAAGLYALGLAVLTVVLDSLELSPRNLVFGIGWAASGYVLLSGLIWSQRNRMTGWRERLSIRQSGVDAERTADWLTVMNLLLAAAVVSIEFWVVLKFDSRPLRFYGATAALLLAPGIALLAHERRRSLLQLLSLLAVAVAAIDFGWASMDVTPDRYFWLQRSIRVMEMLAVTTFLYGVIGVRLVPKMGSWFKSLRTAATALGSASLVSLLVVLVLEASWFNPERGAPSLRDMGAITGPQIAVVAVVLVGLSAALISLAVLPGRDPLNLSERGRMAYVYGAEAVASLVFLHIYLTMPELFRGYLAPYWPFIVMAIAFAGIGTGELFGRLKLPVLAEPLERTGAFLPLLPALGFWIEIRGVDVEGKYWMLLFIAGLLYVMMSMRRRSFVYGLAAALAGNAGLWALWVDRGKSIFSHPQWWFIPPALSALVAAQVNRKRLSEAQLTSIRYLAVTLIYVSSTGEMFITGVAESLWLPIVLALLSIAGVFAGILMRVRAFLYLGSSFLLLSMVSMVWHAAQNIGHVWPWWAFGIAMGLVILTVFGLFEKNRNETLQLVDELRRWDQ